MERGGERARADRGGDRALVGSGGLVGRGETTR